MPKDDSTKTLLEKKYPLLDPSRTLHQNLLAQGLAKLRLGSTEHTQLEGLYYRDLGLKELLLVLQLEQELR